MEIRKFLVRRTFIWACLLVVAAFLLSFGSVGVLLLLLSLAGVVFIHGTIERYKLFTVWEPIVAKSKNVIRPILSVIDCIFVSEFFLLATHHITAIFVPLLVIVFLALSIMIYLLIVRSRSRNTSAEIFGTPDQNNGTHISQTAVFIRPSGSSERGYPLF